MHTCVSFKAQQQNLICQWRLLNLIDNSISNGDRPRVYKVMYLCVLNTVPYIVKGNVAIYKDLNLVFAMSLQSKIALNAHIHNVHHR